MKPKAQKVQPLIKEMIQSPQSFKPQNKLGSPVFKATKTLASCKSDNNLQKGPFNKAQKTQNFESSLTITNSSNPTKKKQKIPNDTKNQIEPKTIVSPKLTNEHSPRAQPTRFFRSQSSVFKEEESELKKAIQQNETKLEDSKKLYEELKLSLEYSKQENEKQEKIICDLKTEKLELEKGLERMKNVAGENRKLLKEKAEGFNHNNEELMKLRLEIQRLENAQKTQQYQNFGTNTEQQNEMINFPNQKIEEAKAEAKVDESIDMQIMKHKDQLKPFREMYERIIKQKDEKIKEGEDTVYEQQKELNQLYEFKHNGTHPKLNISLDQSVLTLLKENKIIKQSSIEQQEKFYQLKQTLRNQARQIDSLKRELEVKQIICQINKGMQEENKEIKALRNQLQQLKAHQKQEQISKKELLDTNKRQEELIKSLRQKKPKIIVK